MTWSIGMPILAFFYMTLNRIYERNPLSFDLVPSNRSMDGNLTLDNPISLTLLSNACWLLFIWSTTPLSSLIVTICESCVASSSTMLVSSSRLKVLGPDVVAGVFGGILLAVLPCRN